MTIFWGIVGYVLYLYLVVVLARVVLETVRQFARSWRPAGTIAVGVESVFVVTDPPLRLLRRWVPPLRLGRLSLDMGIIILLLTILVLYRVVLSFQ